MLRLLGFMICLAVSLGITGCDDPAPRGEPYSGGSVVSAESVEITRVRAWPEDQRAALMRARLAAAGALIGAGQEPEAAAALLGAVLSVYDAAPSDMMAVGLEPSVIEALRSASHSTDVGSEESVRAIAEADASLRALQVQGGEPMDMIGFLVRLCAESFDSGVSLGDIRRPLDYQTSFGLAVLAREAAAGLDPETYGPLQTELRMLVMMWPASGPHSGAVPAPDAQMMEQFLRIRSAMADLP